MLEDTLKELVKNALEDKLGCKVSITHAEWEETKMDALNDVYVNKFCLLNKATGDEFVETMVELFIITKRI